MKISATISWSVIRNGLAFTAALLFGMVLHIDVQALTINVVDPNGVAVTDFRWLVEEDATKDVDFTPAQPGRDLSLSFHTSYMPVAGKGTSASPTIDLDSSKRYYVSVLPGSGYQMGGAQVARGATSVTVTVNPAPIPTAQISVFAFNDNQPINNAPDLPQEQGLAGFSVLLFEPGGTYGISGGQVTQDAFGNPLGSRYDAAGVLIPGSGDGTLKTGADGTLLIKNLPPGKYGIQIVPPAGSNWHQTSTIEGTKTIDAWVKANEPSFFQEFGPPGHHVFIGFVQDFSELPATGGATITGTVVNLHNSRPPDYAFYNGHPIPNCRVGLNELAGGQGRYAGPCNADSSFAIPNVPPGDYQLVVWDEYLDVIFATLNVTVPADATEVALQEVPVFLWFSRIESVVFYDTDKDGFRDSNETFMLPEQAVNLRFRDGSIYQSFPTDLVGYVPFDEVFPFFNWLIAEVDFTRFKATGATIAVDGGGAIDDNEPWSYGGKLSPQPQSENGGAPYRTETGQVLTHAFQGFLGQTSVIEWGKVQYAPGENGGISGVVQYATTRAEDDPRYAAAEFWEPGIPRVQVNLYRDANNDKAIDDNGDGLQLADIDNYPFCWSDAAFATDNPLLCPNGQAAGPEDQNRSGAAATFDVGDAIQVVATDSFDDSLPTGCQGDNMMTTVASDYCFDGLRNFNQVRPGVFDGGYAFNTIFQNGTEIPIPAGSYIVEAITPPGYEHVKEEDKNVDFGDEYVPSPLALPAECVGDTHLVPPVLTLFPAQAVDAAYANQPRRLCDRKHVALQDRQNGAANFFMFTEVPVAAHIVGMILDDTANEFDPNAPTFGEKHAPPFLPVAIRDWTGREITRVHADQYGTFNALVPSTYSMNLPMPSGVSPNMLTACMNSPILPDGSVDPHYNRQYSQFCYTFQYMPGKTTYLDTPVVPIAAFAGPGQYPLDCEFRDATPVIATVDGHAPGAGAGGASLGGPWVPRPPANADLPGNLALQPRLHITSAGKVSVPNPAYDGTPATPAAILRDYGFGTTRGNGRVTFNGTVLPVISWSDDLIVVRVPRSVTTDDETTGQLIVERDVDPDAAGARRPSITGLTVTVGGPNPVRVAPGGSIQAAIDAAPNAGSRLILVPPGRYEELVIMHKPVRLQGWGAHSTTINAVKAPAEKLANWRDKLRTLLDGSGANGEFSLLPGQEVAFNAPDNEPVLFGAEEGPGILVVGGANLNGTPNEFGPGRVARIDGFTITGADHGGGVFASGYARNLQVSNNRIIGNQGTYGGGIRIGHATLLNEAEASGYTDSLNRNVSIHHNQIAQNGSLLGAGGGISIYTGANNYQVSENTVCGNFSTGDGGGIGHLGLSNGGTIANNTIVFNQTFNQGVGVDGGGLFIGGNAPIVPNVLSEGAGDVDVLANVIQGNQAGAGDGGGISLRSVNGMDVQRRPNKPEGWYRVRLNNNIIVDNMAGRAGGGVSLEDSARVDIVHNTVANNDSTATVGAGINFNPAPGEFVQSTPQPAGIVSRRHSTDLTDAFGNNDDVDDYEVYSNPTLRNNIVWHNRSFYWRIDDSTVPATFGLVPDVGAAEAPVFDDLAVLPAGTGCLDPRNSTLTVPGTPDCTYHASNTTAVPRFMTEYVNGAPGQTIVLPETTTSLATAGALDEGGNLIDVRFGPLTLYTVTDPVTGAQGPAYGDYHIRNNSSAEGLGATGTGVNTDVDDQARPNPAGTNPDAGADERL